MGRRFGRAWAWQHRRYSRQRIPNVPLANPVVVASLHQIEMDVVFVVAVGAWTQHRRKPRAYRMQHGLAEIARDVTIGQRDRAAIGELERAHIDRVGTAVFGQLGANDTITPTAFEG